MSLVTTLLVTALMVGSGIILIKQLEKSGKLGGGTTTTPNPTCPAGQTYNTTKKVCEVKPPATGGDGEEEEEEGGGDEEEEEEEEEDEDEEEEDSNRAIRCGVTVAQCNSAWGPQYNCGLGTMSDGRCYCNCTLKPTANRARAYAARAPDINDQNFYSIVTDQYNNLNTPNQMAKRKKAYAPAIRANRYNRQMQKLHYQLRYDLLPQNLQLYQTQPETETRISFRELYGGDDRPDYYDEGQTSALPAMNALVAKNIPRQYEMKMRFTGLV